MCRQCSIFHRWTWEIIEHENGTYSARMSIVNIGNSSEFVLRGHFKPVKHCFSCALQSGVFNLLVHNVHSIVELLVTIVHI